MPQSVNEFAMPDYLVFLILGHIKELRKLQPDHILVKAVSDMLGDESRPQITEQLELLPMPALLNRQAE